AGRTYPPDERRTPGPQKALEQTTRFCGNLPPGTGVERRQVQRLARLVHVPYYESSLRPSRIDPEETHGCNGLRRVLSARCRSTDIHSRCRVVRWSSWITAVVRQN